MTIVERLSSSPDVKQVVLDEIELFHQANFWVLYPSGGPPKDWHMEVIIGKIVQPLLNEIQTLRSAARETKTAKKKTKNIGL